MDSPKDKATQHVTAVHKHFYRRGRRADLLLFDEGDDGRTGSQGDELRLLNKAHALSSHLTICDVTRLEYLWAIVMYNARRIMERRVYQFLNIYGVRKSRMFNIVYSASPGYMFACLLAWLSACRPA